MVTRTVDGTSIQAVLDVSADDDIVQVKNNGTYRGFVIRKRVAVVPYASPFTVVGSLSTAAETNVIDIVGSGAHLGPVDVSGATGPRGSAIIVRGNDVTVDHAVAHHSERGFGIRVWAPDIAHALRPHILYPEVHHVANGIAVEHGGDAGVIDHPWVHDTDRMIVNDPARGNDTGGSSLALLANGALTVLEPRFERAFSTRQTTGPDAGEPASWDYGRDGSFVELYKSRKATITGGTFSGGAPWIVETGKGVGDPDCVDFTMRGTKVFGPYPGAIPVDPAQPGVDLYNSGFLLRSAVNFLFEAVELHDLDHHVFLLDRSGNYASEANIDMVIFRNSFVYLKAGDNRLLTYAGTAPFLPSTFNSMNNRVYTVQGGHVAMVKGVRAETVTQLQSLAPVGAAWELGSTWGPVDPCAAVTAPLNDKIAQLTGQLAAANAQITTVTAQLAASDDSNEKLALEVSAGEAELARLEGIIAKAKAALGEV